MEVTIELTEEQEEAITLKSLNKALNDLYLPSGSELLFSNDIELAKALKLVINHYTVSTAL
jgi:hypothetical protein